MIIVCDNLKLCLHLIFQELDFHDVNFTMSIGGP